MDRNTLKQGIPLVFLFILPLIFEPCGPKCL